MPRGKPGDGDKGEMEAPAGASQEPRQDKEQLVGEAIPASEGDGGKRPGSKRRHEDSVEEARKARALGASDAITVANGQPAVEKRKRDTSADGN
eukprot:15357611-Alexandrium_andersonii.AAC.1